MIVEVGGGAGGLRAYLEDGRKKGRDLHRDELDQRIPLAGDLEAFELACDAFTSNGDRYDHFTLSFSEDHVSDRMLLTAVEEFRGHVFAAWPEAQRSRVAFYAEAHRPKHKSYVHAETGELVERKTHIHIVIGRRDLLTGKHVQLVGYLGPGSDNLKYMDAWQESFNARHGFSSPKSSPRVSPETAIDMLARYTGQRPDELGTFGQRKAALELQIQKAILDQDVTNWVDLERLLARFGAVSKVRAGKFNEAFAVTPRGASRRMRLQGVFFQRDFIERPTAEKRQILMERARRAYIEQQAPLVDPAHLRSTLSEWRAVRAREIRFLHTGSRFYKEVYVAADAVERAQILANLQRESERNFDGIPSPADDPQRQAAATRDRLPKLPVRHMDGIQARSAMLLRRDDGLDVRARSAGSPDGARLRQAVGDGAGRGRARGPLMQPSRVVTQLRDEQVERDESTRVEGKYREIGRNLDCQQLLARLSHSHGLQSVLYSAECAADGSPRIRCGSRLLSPNDFLTREMGLRWREAAPILREVYEQQVGRRVVRTRTHGDGAERRRLWREFRLSEVQASVTERLGQFDAQTKAGREALAAQLRHERAKAIAGLQGRERSSASAAQRLLGSVVRADYAKARRDARRLLRPVQGDAWRWFLQQRAQAGDTAALDVLRRLDGSAREADVLTISNAVEVSPHTLQKKRRALAASAVLQAFEHRVERNGDVTYMAGSRALLRDQGDRLQVLDPESDEAILAALAIAQDLFGPTLTLTGPARFQRRVAELASEHRLAVRFEDRDLEGVRVRAYATKRGEKHRSESKSSGDHENPPAFVIDSEVSAAAAQTRIEPPELALFVDVEALQPNAAEDAALLGAEAQSHIEAELQRQGWEVRTIENGQISVGQVLEMTTGGLLVQRDAPRAVIVHNTARLDRECQVGQIVEIRYDRDLNVGRLNASERPLNLDKGL